MNSNPRQEQIEIKVERAKTHLIELNRVVEAFLASTPYTVVKRADPQTGKHGYEMAQVAGVPSTITAVFGDVLQNLRSALDHLANQLLLVNLRAERTNQEFNFPICGDLSKHEALFQGKPKLRGDAWRALQALRAYRGGSGHQFWVLNRLNNIDKHRLMLFAGSASRSVNLGALVSRQLQDFMTTLPAGHPAKHDVPIVDAFFQPADNQCPLKVGDLLIVGLDLSMEMDSNRDFRFEVAINEPNVLDGKPVIEAAQEFADLVSGTVKSFRPYLE